MREGLSNDPTGTRARTYAFGPFVLVPERQVLLRGEARVRVGGRALEILTALVERPGDIVSKSELLARVWPDTKVEESNLKVNVGALRHALGEGHGSDRYIATVVGRGYRFVAPVQTSVSVEPSVEAGSASKLLHNLPTGTTRIFGRANEISTLRRDLEDWRLVSILGPGGIGKTTVALAVAEQTVASFAHGVWLIDLSPLKDSALVPNAIATAIGLVPQLPNMLEAVCAFLRDRHLLLVLDSCEHLIEAAAACAHRILADAAGIKVLATSREPLMVTGELVRRLPGLETPADSAVGAEHALTFPAVQLFVERATDRLESFELSDAEAPTVVEICRSLDGLALAIELAATRVDTFGVRSLRKQLDDRFRLLTGRRAGPARQRTLTATLDWSYSLLADDEAALLRAVSVFAGVFDSAGASSCSGMSRSRSSDLLAQLAAKSVLATDLDADGIAYRLLESTRSYCLEHLRAAGEDHAVRWRHAEHVCALLGQAASEWARRGPREWGATYGRLLDDLRGALDWAANDTARQALRIRLTVAGLTLWNHFSLTEECRVQVARAVEDLDAAGLAGTPAEMQLQMWLGRATMFTHGFTSEAMSAMRRALAVAIQNGDLEGRARCLRFIGVYELFTGENEAAVHTLETLASLVAAAELPPALLDADPALGIGELFVGRLESVRRRFERRHALDRQALEDAHRRQTQARYLSDRIVDVGNVLSQVQWLTGSPDTALSTAAATIEHAVSTKNHVSLSTALSWVCPVFYWSGRYEDCARYVELLADEVERHTYEIRRPVASFYRAALACTHHGPSHAVDGLEEAIAGFHATGHLARLPFYLGVLADFLAKRDRLDVAEATIHSALERANAKSERWCVPELLRIQASIRVGQGEPKEAETLLVHSMALAREIGARSWRLRAANDLARMWRESSRSEDALETLRHVLDEFTEGFTTLDLMIATDLLTSLRAR